MTGNVRKCIIVGPSVTPQRVLFVSDTSLSTIQKYRVLHNNAFMVNLLPATMKRTWVSTQSDVACSFDHGLLQTNDLATDRNDG